MILLEDIPEEGADPGELIEAMVALHRPSQAWLGDWWSQRAEAGLAPLHRPACPVPDEFIGMSQGVAYVRGMVDARGGSGLD